MTKQKEKFDVGVIVARFQVDDLHDGHHAVIDQVEKASTRTIVFLGTTVVLDSIRDPLDFPTRYPMVINATRPGTLVLPLPDIPDDNRWSKELDKRISEVCQIGKIALFGSRDSFIPHYTGKHKTVELESVSSPAGIDLRHAIASEPIDSTEFRRGIIYAKMNQWPKFHPTVDLAIYRYALGGTSPNDAEILFGKKPGETLWRLIGGFMDPSKDKSADDAVKREGFEETGEGKLAFADPEYICTAHIPDSRYNDGRNKIMTTFFAASYMFGFAQASDDIAEVAWLKVNDVRKNLTMVAPYHRELVTKLLEKKWPQA